MTLKQIGGNLTYTKESGVYSLEDQIELKKTSNQIENYRFLKDVLKFWPTSEVLESSFVFNNNGTKSFLMGVTNNRIYQFSAESPFDGSTLSLDGVVVTPKAGISSGNVSETFTFGDSGNKLYTFNSVGVSIGSTIYQYSCQSPYDAKNITLEATYNTLPNTSSVGIAFSVNGQVMITAGVSTEFISTYNLNSPWNIGGTVTYDSASRLKHFNNINSFWINSSGTKLVLNDTSSGIFKYNLSTPWNPSTGTLDNVDVYDLGISSTSSATGVFYGNNGNRLYILRDNGDVTQLSLGSAYRANNITSYTTKTAPTISNGPTSGFIGIAFQTSGANVGRRYWAFNQNTDTIYEYTLASAPESWDIAYASYNNKSLDISLVVLSNPTTSGITSETLCKGFSFNDTGTKLYILGDLGDAISELKLSTAWDISSVTFDIVKSRVAISSDTSMQDVAFSDDGTKFYTIGSVGATKQVYQYNLSTAWDITTSGIGSAVDKTFDINTGGTSRDTDPRAIRFGDSGKKLFILGNQNNVVLAYNMPVDGGGNATWDVSGATYASQVVINTAQIASGDVPSGLDFSADGTKMFILGDEATNAVYQYSLSPSWSVGSATISTPTGGFTISDAIEDNPTGIKFGDSGYKMYIVGSTDDTIRQFNLSVSYDINSSITTQATTISTSAIDGNVTGIDFSSDGKIIFICGNTNDRIYAYRLSTAWDLSSFSINRFQLTTPIAYVGLAIGNGDDNLYWWDATNSNLVRRDMTIAGIVTSGGTNTTKNLYPYKNNINALGISSVGSHIAMVANSWLYTFNMSTPYDVTSIKGDNLNISGLVAGASAISMKDDGSKLYLTINVSGTTPRIYQYPLTTNYDFNTFTSPSFSATYDNHGNLRLLSEIYLSSDGSSIWTLPVSPSHDIIKYNLTTPYDTDTIWYGGYQLTGNPATNQHTIRYNQDGTRLYLMTLTAIHQFDLNTPFDLKTAVNNNKSISFSIDTSPVSFEVSTDESVIYILGDELNAIFQYRVKTPGDIRTAYYLNNLNLSSQGQEGDPKSSVLSTDGTKMYVLIGVTIYQYTLSTAFNPTTATYASKSFSIGGIAADPKKLLVLGTDGKSMALLDGSSGSSRVVQFYLDTAWDISTAWFEKTKSVSAQDAAPSSIYIGPPQTVSGVTAGTRMYIAGSDDSSTDSIFEYTLSTPWDVTTATTAGTLILPTIDPNGIFFNPEGTRLFVNCDGTNAFHQYTLSTPWDLSTAYLYKNVSFTSQDSLPSDIVFCKYGADAGKILYVLGDTNDRIYQYHLGTAYTVTTLNTSTSTATVGGVANVPGRKTSAVLSTLSNSGGATNWSGLDFSDDGKKVYLCEDTYNRVIQFNLDTEWDISTLRGLTKKGFPAANNGAVGFTFGKDGSAGTLGKRLYVCDISDVLIYQYDSSVGYAVTTINVTTSTVNGVAGYKTLNISGSGTLNGDTSPYAVNISDDGTKLYILGDTNNRVVELILDTAWDVTSARNPYKTFSVSSQTTTSSAITFKTDGTKMYVMSSTTADVVYQYSLSTAWDVSTATYESKSFTLQTETVHTGFDITDVYDAGGGTWKQHLYAVGITDDRVYRYTISAATSTDAKFWDITQFGTVEATTLLVQPSSETAQHSIKISKDGANAGKYLTLVGQTNDDVYFYYMSTAYALSTATLLSGTKDVSIEGTPSGVAVAYGSGVTEGTVFYVVGDSSDTIREYSLKQSGVLTAWASGTITWTLERSTLIGSNSRVNITAATDLAVSKNGDWIYVLDASNVYGFPMETAHNLRTANKGDYYIGAEELTPQGFRFANDGIELYVYGASGDDLNRYTLSKAWNVSSAAFVSSSSNLTDSTPYGLEVKNDGSKYWVVGATDTIREYTPSVNYNTTLTAGTTKDISYLVSDPRDIKFNNDGTKFFAITLTEIFEFDVDSAYVTNAINTQWYPSTDITPTGIKFKSNNTVGGTGNGTKFAVIGQTADAVRTYVCAYAWNVSSVTSSSVSSTMTETGLQGICFNVDGSKCYLTGTSGEFINEHSAIDYASVSTTISNQTYIGNTLADPYGLDISNDGTKMFVLQDGSIHELLLDTAYNVKSIFVDRIIQSLDTNPQGLHIGDSGTKLTFFGSTNDDIRVFSLPYAWNINNFTSYIVQTTVPDISITGVWVSDNGLSISMLGQSGDKIYRYTTSTGWSFSSWSSAGTNNVYNLAHRLDSAGLCFDYSGTMMYFINGTTVVQIPLETAWQPDSAYSAIMSVSGQDTAPVSICETSDGLNLYMLGDGGNDIQRYILAAANKITTHSVSTAVAHGTGDNLVTGIECNSTASVFWLTGPTDKIYQIANSGSSGALGSFTQTTNIDVSRIDNMPIDINLSSNGNYLYFTGQQYDSIYRLDLTTNSTLVGGYYTYILDISSQTTSPVSITKSQNSKKLFVHDVNFILEYSIPSNLSIVETTYAQKYLYTGTSAGGAVTPKDIHLSLNGKYFYVLDQNQDEVKVYNTILK